MTDSTHGIQLTSGSRTLRAAVELLSSMRFSIALFALICIASVIGTVLKQREPFGNYVNQFGPFWADVFDACSLYNVYSAWWFLLILAFLVVSTSLCVVRNTPKIMKDLRTYKESVRIQSLQAFPHRAQAVLPGTAPDVAQRLGKLLAGGGWKVKLQARETPAGVGWMVAAKIGGMNKVGYLAAHSAIVLVCLGGLLDGDLMVRAQMLFNGKTVYTGAGMFADVPPAHRLSDRNPTFRGNLLVTEGTQSSTAVLTQSDGVLLQELPFSVELKKFIVEYYSSGMPKLFASDIVIHDKETGQAIPARVEVNHPVNHRGIEIYQSSFDDGGSSVQVRAVPIHAPAPALELQGRVGTSAPLAQTPLTIEYTGLRVINVENFDTPQNAGVDVRKVDLRAAMNERMGAANKTDSAKNLRNIGPSISYKLRDSAGQAREFNNYMLPVDMGDGFSVYLWGMRDAPSEAFRYLRIPADDQGSTDEFFRLRFALLNPQARELAVQRYAQKMVDANRPDLVQKLANSALRALTLFAGSIDDGKTPPQAGLQAVASFIEANVPAAERDNAGEVLIRILNGAIFELAQIERAKAGLPALEVNEKTQAFMTQTVLALSDAPLYPAPVALQLTNFDHVQASVFQVARAPGKKVVYLGCALLILGIFAMLYIRERRLWIWLEPHTPEASTEPTHVRATMALSTNRKTMDADQEFVQLQSKLLGTNE